MTAAGGQAGDATAEGERAESGPLSGVRILDLSINVLGPVATLMLGDMGADVVKVESPGGDPMRGLGAQRSPGMAAHFVNMNRNKRSVTLDLKQPDDMQALMRLVETADVFVHNMRADAAERLGVGPKAVQARNPAIIYAFATGYRHDGPKAARPAYDDVIQGESGLAGLFRDAGGEPRFVPSAVADKLCGVYLASAISAALFRRERHGGGEIVHVPMMETMAFFVLLDHLWEATFSGRPQDAGYPRVLSPNRRPYPTKDGHICVVAITDAQWGRLFEALDRPDLASDPRLASMTERTKHIDALYALVGDEVRKYTTADCVARLDAVDLPNAPVNGLADLLASEYLWSTGFFRKEGGPSDDRCLSMDFPLSFSESPGGERRPPPLLGEHNREILDEIVRRDAGRGGVARA